MQEHQFTKKSKMILGQVQQRQKQEEDEQMESSIAQLTDKDPFNLSNDDYYRPKNVERLSGILRVFLGLMKCVYEIYNRDVCK